MAFELYLRFSPECSVYESLPNSQVRNLNLNFLQQAQLFRHSIFTSGNNTWVGKPKKKVNVLGS